MKKYLIITVLLLCVALAFPHIWNSCFADNPKYAVTHIDVNDWNSAAPPIISALTSLLVIVQAEKQRETSEKAQERMERINERMLDVERKQKRGYFVPLVFEKTKDGRNVEKNHPLKNYIILRNSGNDGVFALTKSISVCGKEKHLPHRNPLWVACEDPFDTINYECFITDEELTNKRIDISISLLLTNTVGYKYIQELDLGFEVKNGQGVVCRFNMNLLEAENNAD